jgi:hypothetical protein
LGKQSFEDIPYFINLIVFFTSQFDEGNKAQEQLNKAIGLEFTDTNCFRAKKQAEVSKRFVRKFNSEKGKHRISGLDREIVYARDWAMSVFLVLDAFF